MRNTCALNIAAIPPKVQLLVVTNAQRLCDTTENASLHTRLHLTSGPRHLNPGNQHLISGNDGSQTTLPHEAKTKDSTYASSCFVPPGEPENGLLTGEK